MGIKQVVKLNYCTFQKLLFLFCCF